MSAEVSLQDTGRRKKLCLRRLHWSCRFLEGVDAVMYGDYATLSQFPVNYEEY